MIIEYFEIGNIRLLMIDPRELQNLIVELSGRMERIERFHAGRHSPPLSPAEMTGMRLIVRNAPVQMNAFAKGAGVPQSSATNLADKLCRRGLAARHRSESNRRVVTLTPTEAGRALIADIELEQVALCDELVAGVAPDEAGLLRQLLNRLTKNHKTN